MSLNEDAGGSKNLIIKVKRLQNVTRNRNGMINHMRTMGLVEFLDSLLMVHPWQHADGYGFGVNINIILERSTILTGCDPSWSCL